MIKCYVSKYNNLCFGASLAVEAAYEHLSDSLYLYGDVINNPVVTADLRSKGAKIINDITKMKDTRNLKLLIRAHGVPEKTIDYLKDNNVNYIDKTCPKVKKIHKIVKEASSRGLDIIIIGEPNHPEVVGIKGWAKTNVIIIKDMISAKEKVPYCNFSSTGVCMVVQTTYNRKAYEEIRKYCLTLLPSVECHDTICNDTANRQIEIRNLAQQVDCIIIIGGKKSSNSIKLFEIASEYCNKTQHAQTESEIDLTIIENVSSLAIVGGASTPIESINKSIEILRSACYNRGIEFELIRQT